MERERFPARRTGRTKKSVAPLLAACIMRAYRQPKGPERMLLSQELRRGDARSPTAVVGRLPQEARKHRLRDERARRFRSSGTTRSASATRIAYAPGGSPYLHAARSRWISGSEAWVSAGRERPIEDGRGSCRGVPPRRRSRPASSNRRGLAAGVGDRRAARSKAAAASPGRIAPSPPSPPARASSRPPDRRRSRRGPGARPAVLASSSLREQLVRSSTLGGGPPW